MRRFASIVLLVGLACASGPLPIASSPIDWEAATERWSLHIVTVDPDGDERVTRIWLALVDGEGTVRTGDSRWWQNLKRDPKCRATTSLASTRYAMARLPPNGSGFSCNRQR